MLENVFAVRLVPQAIIFEYDLTSRENLGTEVNFLEFLVIDPVFLEELDEPFFRFKTSEFLALGKGF